MRWMTFFSVWLLPVMALALEDNRRSVDTIDATMMLLLIIAPSVAVIAGISLLRYKAWEKTYYQNRLKELDQEVEKLKQEKVYFVESDPAYDDIFREIERLKKVI